MEKLMTLGDTNTAVSQNLPITKEMDDFFDKRFQNIIDKEKKLKEIEENRKEKEKRYEVDKEYIGLEIYPHFINFMKYLSDKQVKGTVSFSPNYLGWYLPIKIGYCYVNIIPEYKSSSTHHADCCINGCDEKYFNIAYPREEKIYLKSVNKYMYNGDHNKFTDGNYSDFTHLKSGDKIWFFKRSFEEKEKSNERLRSSWTPNHGPAGPATCDDYHDIFEMELNTRAISTIKVIIDCENKNITKNGPTFELNLNDKSILDNSALYTSNISLKSDIEFKDKFITKQEEFDTKQLNSTLINEKLFSWLETIIKNGVLI